MVELTKTLCFIGIPCIVVLILGLKTLNKNVKSMDIHLGKKFGFKSTFYENDSDKSNKK